MSAENSVKYKILQDAVDAYLSSPVIDGPPALIRDLRQICLDRADKYDRLQKNFFNIADQL